MTKDNASNYLPFVQALADHRTIEVVDANGVWKIHDNLKFDEPADHYRIALSAGQVAYEAYGDKGAIGDWRFCSVKDWWESSASAVIAHHEAQKTKVTIVENATAVHMEPQYRDLVPEVDTWQKGDEKYHPWSKEWKPANSFFGEKLDGTLQGRRKVTAPTEPAPEVTPPPWTPPAPPVGREWHKPIKECWDDGKRALLTIEAFDGSVDECKYTDGTDNYWGAGCSFHGRIASTINEYTLRTSRPLPSTPKIVPLEACDYEVGDALRFEHGGTVNIIRIYDGELWFLGSDGDMLQATPQHLSTSTRMRKRLSTEWQKCEKEGI